MIGMYSCRIKKKRVYKSICYLTAVSKNVKHSLTHSLPSIVKRSHRRERLVRWISVCVEDVMDGENADVVVCVERLEFEFNLDIRSCMYEKLPDIPVTITKWWWNVSLWVWHGIHAYTYTTGGLTEKKFAAVYAYIYMNFARIFHSVGECSVYIHRMLFSFQLENTLHFPPISLVATRIYRGAPLIDIFCM